MKNEADPVDVHVGARMRQRRFILGQSQVGLAEDLGVTFQQVQKYEKGTNRVSASMMFRAGASQGVPPAYYFEGLTVVGETEIPRDLVAAVEWLGTSEAALIARGMAALNPQARKLVRVLVGALEDEPSCSAAS
jgi:transcriptional regulator with XRE-family HTH domain